MKLSFLMFFLTLALATPTDLGAQSAVLSVEGPSLAGVGQSFEATVFLELSGPDEADGWSYGVCHDPLVLSLDSVVDGVVPQTANNGGDVFFNQQIVTADGYSVGVVICGTGCATLPPGSGYEMSIGTYTALQASTTLIAPCDTIGLPAAPTVIDVMGVFVIPTPIPLDLEVTDGPTFTARAPDLLVPYSAADGAAVFDVEISLEQDNTGFALLETAGYFLGMAHDPTLLEVVSVTSDLPLDGAHFIDVYLADPNGWRIGVVFSLAGSNSFQLTGQTVATATYQTIALSPLTGNDMGTTTTLEFSDSIGIPQADLVVVDNAGASHPPHLDHGSVTFIPDSFFRRGDANHDGIYDLADGIAILNGLFAAGPISPCQGTRDSNADGQVDIADALSILTYLFAGGAPPPAPFPGCGPGIVDECDQYLGGC